MPQSKLAKFLDLTDEQLDEMGLDEDNIHEDTGSSGEMTYSYYFNVPENTPQYILDEKGWVVGDRVEIPLGFFDDEPSEPDKIWYNREIALEQALVAVVGAYRTKGGDVSKLLQDAQGLILGHSEYRIVEHPHVTQACIEIENAANFKK